MSSLVGWSPASEPVPLSGTTVGAFLAVGTCSRKADALSRDGASAVHSLLLGCAPL